METLEGALGVPVVVHGAVDSTMETAREDSRAPVVHVAEEQRAGQGRHGRRWVSPPGNLYATVAWPEEAEPLPPGLLAAVQVAWVEAIAGAGGPLTRCKWPNDGWVDGGKWSGLLARRVAGGRLLVGLGANLERAPGAEALEPGSVPAAALVDHWRPWPGRERVGTLLLAAALAVLREGPSGVAERLARWARHDALEPGAAIRVETSGGELRGRYRGLAPDGRLRLATRDGEVLLAVGQAERLRFA